MSKPRLELSIFFLLILVSVIGAGARFINLDLKEFWCDESCTEIIVSGHNGSELTAALSPRIVRFSELVPFRVAGAMSTPQNIIKGICADEPGHPPLFYFIEVLWTRLLGSSPFTYRLISAVISVLTLPVIFWLGLETYKSRMLAALTTAFASWSPALIYFAQEARDYSLGLFFMSLSSALLLYALRTSKCLAWVGYGMSALVGCFSWLFMVIVVAGQGLYIAATKEMRAKFGVPFGITIGAVAILFSPWLVLLHEHADDFDRAYSWIQPTLPLQSMINVWLTIPCKAFALLGLRTGSFETMLLFVTALEFFAIAITARQFRTPKFLQLCIIAAWFLVFGAQDILMGGARSAPFRYQSVVICAILILFSGLIEGLWQKNIKLVQAIAVAIVVSLLGIEVFSSTFYLQERLWPNKAIRLRFTQPLAAVLNREKSPLLVCEWNRINIPEILDLSHYIKDDARVLYRTREKSTSLPVDEPKLYLWNPSMQIEKELATSGYTVSNSPDGLPYLKVATRGINQ